MIFSPATKDRALLPWSGWFQDTAVQAAKKIDVEGDGLHAVRISTKSGPKDRTLLPQAGA